MNINANYFSFKKKEPGFFLGCGSRNTLILKIDKISSERNLPVKFLKGLGEVYCNTHCCVRERNTAVLWLCHLLFGKCVAIFYFKTWLY